jgi:hypothetical protein
MAVTLHGGVFDGEVIPLDHLVPAIVMPSLPPQGHSCLYTHFQSDEYRMTDRENAEWYSAYTSLGLDLDDPLADDTEQFSHG